MLLTVALGTWLYLVLLYQCAVEPTYVVGVVLGVVAGTRLPTARAPAAAALSYLLGACLAPPQWTLFETFFNEPNYVAILNETGPAHWPSLIAGLLVAAGLAEACTRVRWRRRNRRDVGILLLGLLCLNYVPHVLGMSPMIPAEMHEPADKSYHFDGYQMLKTVYLMRHGETYYAAYRHACEVDQRDFSSGLGFQSIRPPFAYWMWAALPDAVWILYGAWLLSIVGMIVTWTACARDGDPIAALAAPATLGAFWSYTQMSMWVTYADLWAGFLLVPCAALYALGRERLAAGAAFLAMLIRELAVFVILSGLIISLLQRRYRDAALWAALLTAGVMVYACNDNLSHQALGMSLGSTLSNRLDGSLSFSLSTLRFGSILIGARDLALPILALLFFSNANNQRFLTLAVAMHMGAFLKIGNPGFAQYYSFDYVPIMIVGTGLAFARLERTAPWTPTTSTAVL